MIVYDNGRSGFLGEHACMDGTPTLRMNEFVLASLASGKADLGPTRANTSRLPGVEELVFELDDKVHKAVKDAESRFDELVGKHQLEVCIYIYAPFKTFDHISFRYYNMMALAKTLARNTKLLQTLLLN